MNTFKEFMNKVGTSNEIKFVVKIAEGNKEYEEKIMEFIKENSIDCNHLWEESDEGDRAFDDWNKLIEYALELIPEKEE